MNKGAGNQFSILPERGDTAVKGEQRRVLLARFAARAPHRFDPCELLLRAARSKLPRFREREMGGGPRGGEAASASNSSPELASRAQALAGFVRECLLLAV
jgi:hypothetical protein